ncbi:MAG: methylcobamide--CoM methyltransferase [Deltaproteobacteria bacterium HGW-Deltaproteobacteria-13]|nr:MAG: methylcobamide--CoM methyltransferase [Deltaproteobacteria bacterium HGW-Deltaproteobacteria-13]
MSKRNMQHWVQEILDSRKRMAFPLMPYIGLELTKKKVLDVVKNGRCQGECIKAVASKYPSAASITIMDLSVEAEAFGSTIRFAENEVPTAVGVLVNDADAAQALEVPRIGSKRTGEYLHAAALAADLVTDRPVFGCHIGPFSLAARLCGMTEIMVKIRKEPEMIHTVLDKCTDFLVEYAKAYKDTGISGIVIAEPAAGLISPAQCETFSSKYVARIVSTVQDENFMVILHNCGNTTKLVPAILKTGAMGIHFGNAVDMVQIMPQVPVSVIAFGNINPVLFRNGSAAEIKEKTAELLHAMERYPNFVISSGCDIPPGTPFENINAFFKALDFYL